MAANHVSVSVSIPRTTLEAFRELVVKRKAARKAFAENSEIDLPVVTFSSECARLMEDAVLDEDRRRRTRGKRPDLRSAVSPDPSPAPVPSRRRHPVMGPTTPVGVPGF